MARVTANVSGVKFEFSGNIVEKYHEHTLMTMLGNMREKNQTTELIVDRPPDCFAAILAFYQTGELHIPTALCPSAFRRELEFWKISASYMPKCCAYRYHGHFEEMETHENFKIHSGKRKSFNNQPQLKEMTSSWNRLRNLVWNIVDYKVSTLPAKRRLTKCEYLEYLEEIGNRDVEKAREKLGVDECGGSSFFEESDNDISFDWDYDWTYYYWDYVENVNKSAQVTLPVVETRLYVFEILEMITVAFFTLDFIIRLVCCPSLRNFFRSFTNIIDFLALGGFYVYILIINLEKKHRYNYGLIKFLNYFQIFRTLRVIRIVSNIRATRVLVFSIRQNIKDMLMLVLMLTVAVSVTSHLIYFMEDPKTIGSIPNAWYWAVITLTTVGYGDITPVTALGKILASLMAISGVLLLAVTLPMFVNNFLTLYQYACLDEYIGSKESEEQSPGQDSSPVSNHALTKDTSIIHDSRPIKGDGMESFKMRLPGETEQ
ncbi:KCNAB-like protein [Mya arenaria]|uniref:KCNAB-like protein n=1 Tax=Mya arenaria TaxID=6604 RepID=A0ABY7EZY2_MYAAR|nr:KCNAB-like protein [Mya arenaria]